MTTIFCPEMNSILEFDGKRYRPSRTRIVMSPSTTTRLIDTFDNMPHTLNVNNGVLSLDDGKLRPHSDAILTTKLAPVDYLPNAPCPKWEALLKKIWPGQDEIIRQVQKRFGQALTGLRNLYEVVFLVDGVVPAPEHDFLLHAFAAVLGDYALTLVPDNNPFHSWGMGQAALLRGVRMVVAHTPSTRIAGDLFKRWVDNNQMVGRIQRNLAFTFTPSHKLFLWGTEPQFSKADGANHSVQRRIVKIPMACTVGSEWRRGGLPFLHGEATGILAWAMRGYRWYQHEGMA